MTTVYLVLMIVACALIGYTSTMRWWPRAALAVHRRRYKRALFYHFLHGLGFATIGLTAHKIWSIIRTMT